MDIGDLWHRLGDDHPHVLARDPCGTLPPGNILIPWADMKLTEAEFDEIKVAAKLKTEGG